MQEYSPYADGQSAPLIQQLKALELEAQRLFQENVKLQAQLILLHSEVEKKRLNNAAFC